MISRAKDAAASDPPTQSRRSAAGEHGGDDSPLGSILASNGLVSDEALREARKRQRGAKCPLADVLIEQEVMDEDKLLQFISKHSGRPVLSAEELEPSEEAQAYLSTESSSRYGILPLRVEDDTLHIATSDPFQLTMLDNLAARSGLRLRVGLAGPTALHAALISIRPEEEVLDDFLRNRPSSEPDLSFEAEGEEGGEGPSDAVLIEVQDSDSPVVRFVSFVIADAIRQEASDIHLEAEEQSLRIRFRIDGELHDVQSMPAEVQQPVVSRLKIISGLNIIETRRPQDGRVKVKLKGKSYDLRVSTIPSYFGEKVVIRVLDSNVNTLKLDQSGLDDDVLASWRELLHRPNGLLLLTGPTGSGKTSTLYSSLLEIRSPTLNIVTVEDPVEYQFPGIVQVPVRHDIGMTFAAALRSILRQDPDVVLLGEIRDAETAEVAVQAALTGHLVLSTLHTNDAIGAIPRLLNLGVERQLLSSCLLGVMAQRLVRTVCSECAIEFAWSKETLIRLGPPPGRGETYHGKKGEGCARCRGSGMRGRTALTELVRANGALKELILSGAEDSQLLTCAQAAGMRPLTECGRRKVLAGTTSPDEVLSVAGPAPEAAASARQPMAAPDSEPSAPSEAKVHLNALPPARALPAARRTVTRAACASCGETLRSNWRLCPVCGTGVPEEAPSQTALICDDQALQRKIVGAALKDLGLGIVEAVDGAACLDAIARQQPDILIVDQVMPGLTGVEVIRQLRNQLSTASLPVIMLTATEDDTMETIVLDAGADDYLTKPVVPERLRARVSALLRSRSRMGERRLARGDA